MNSKTTDSMSSFPVGTGTFLAGMIAGSFLAMMLDPVGGSRRRALVRDKSVHLKKSFTSVASRKVRDMSNRAQGVVARVSHIHDQEDNPGDEVLLQRVRSVFGRKVSHAKAIHVDVTNGEVTLAGKIPSGEVATLISTVSSVRGVTRVINELDVGSAQI